MDDGSVTMDTGPGAAETLLYVAKVVALGKRTDVGGSTLTEGVNLDGLESDGGDPAGCHHADYDSPPPDNEAGSDNELGPTLAGLEDVFDIDGPIAESILDGSYLLLFELQEVNDRVNDPTVTMNMYVGHLPPGVDVPADDDGDGLIDPGQTFEISGEPFVNTSGAIVNGRFRAGPVSIAMNLPAGGFALNLNGAQVRFSIAGNGATSGLIAGGVDAEELIVTLRDVADLPVSEAVIRGLVETAADLEPSADGGECAAVSMALTFEGVSAVRGAIER